MWLRLALVLLSCAAFAQTSATHRGIVRSDGQPVPGASVTATSGERKLTSSTGENGVYEFTDLAPGRWTLLVEIFGFRIAQQELNITTGQNPPLEWQIELESSIEAEIMDDENAPLELHPTEAEPDETGSSTPSPEPEDPSANDAFLINGSLSSGLQPPPLEEGPALTSPSADPAPPIEEASTNHPASSGKVKAAGRPAGLKSGKVKAPGSARKARPAAARFGNKRKAKKTATLRGSAYWRFRDSALDARPYSINGALLPKPEYSQNRFGLNAGGPLKIPYLLSGERTFFYLNYDGGLARNPYNSVSTVPTRLERAGDLSQSVTRGPVTIFDLLNQQPFPANRIPPSRLNAASRGLLDFIPLPNQDSRVQNYQFITSVPQDTHSLGVRLNQGFSRRNRLSGAYSYQFREGENAQAFGFRDSTGGRGHRFDLGWTRNFSARTTNNLRFGLNRNVHNLLPFFAFGRDVAGELGIQGTSRDPVNFGPPNLRFTNFGDLNDGVPVVRRDRNWFFNESLSWVRGRHTLGFGGELRRIHLDNSSDPSGRGSLTFSGLLTSALDSGGQPLGNSGFDFADFLLGYPQSSSVRFGLRDTFFRSWNYSAFVNDDFRARPNLTLTLGARYEYFSPLAEKFGQLSNLDIAPDFTGVSRVTPDMPGLYSGAFPPSLIDPDRNNFSPRLGLAWRPSRMGRLLVRAGYGWFYNGAVFNSFAPRLATQPPFARTGIRSTSLANPLTIEEGFTAAAMSDRVTNTFAVDRSYRVGYAQTWNVAVQKELPQALVLELGYQGAKGTRLDIQRLPNRAAPGSPLTAEERRRIGNAVGFTWDSSEGNSIYHAGQARLTRRFKSGLSANMLYTFSKSIDNASNMGGGGNVVAQNDRDLRSERGLSSFDRRHSLNLNLLYASTIGGRGSRIRMEGIAGRLLANWSLSGGLTMLSGTPFTARVLGNRADSGGTGVVGSGRADSTGESVTGGHFFNLAAFALPPAGRFGNAGRNTIPGPGLCSLNASLGRSLRVSERQRLELRLESTNVLNHVNVTGIGATVNASNYGLPLAAAPTRSVSLSARFRF